jgi:hypothetical protein
VFELCSDWLEETTRVTVGADQSLSAADRRRRDGVATRPGRHDPGYRLPAEPVVEGLVCWNGPPDTESRPDSRGQHLTELGERPPPEAAPRHGGAPPGCTPFLADTYSNPM